MVKYQRLKSIDGSGTIMRYYELVDGEDAYTNAFYAIKNGKATKIVGEVSGAGLIGFSHGGNALAEGLILLDINPAVAYLCALADGDTKPNIGDLVNGYLRVIDTHYDNDEASGKGTLPEEWGIERMDNPYFIAVIEQPDAINVPTVDDADCGDLTPYQKKKEAEV